MSGPKEKTEVKASQMMDVKRLGEYLGNLAENFKAGSLFVEDGQTQLFLKPPADALSVKMKAKEKKGKAKFQISISWSLTQAGEGEIGEKTVEQAIAEKSEEADS